MESRPRWVAIVCLVLVVASITVVGSATDATAPQRHESSIAGTASALGGSAVECANEGTSVARPESSGPSVRAKFPGAGRVVDSDVNLPELTSGGELAFDLGAQGRPHVAYYEDRRNLTYARLTPSGWQTEQVMTAEKVPANPWRYSFSFAVDEDNDPHIVYFTEVDGVHRLMYAHRRSGEWETEPIETGIIGTPFALTVDDGTPHVVYKSHRQQTFGQPRVYHTIRYAKREDGEWIHENVSTSRKGPTDLLSVAVENERPTVATVTTWRYGQQIEVIAFNESDQWNRTTVTGLSNDDTVESLELTVADGEPHLLYGITKDYESNRVQYATVEGDAWNATTLENRSRNKIGEVADLAVDAEGRVHAIYDRGTGGGDSTLRYAIGEDGHWRRQDVGLVSQRANARLTLDDSGNPHLAYHTGNVGTPESKMVKYLTGETVPLRGSVVMPLVQVRNARPPSVTPGGVGRGTLTIRNVGTQGGVGLVVLHYPASLNVSIPDTPESTEVLAQHEGLVVFKVSLGIQRTIYQRYTIELPREAVFGQNASIEVGDGVPLRADVVASLPPDVWANVSEAHSDPFNRSVAGVSRARSYHRSVVGALASCNEDEVQKTLDELSAGSPRLAVLLREFVCVRASMNRTTPETYCTGSTVAEVNQ